MTTRWSWVETWLGVADVVARRSACKRTQTGAVIVTPKNRIVATGYNGPPADLRMPAGALAGQERDSTVRATCRDHCPRYLERSFGGHDGAAGSDYGSCISIHAEANALLFCDRRDREGGTIYVTRVPCLECGKLIANSGVRYVVFRDNDDAHLPAAGMVSYLQSCDLRVKVF